MEDSREDNYVGVDFDGDKNDDSDIKSVEFIDIEPKEIKVLENDKEKMSQFFGEDNKLIAEKIIEKKSGTIIEIKYNSLGKKAHLTEKNKNKKITKIADYYENGSPKMITFYGDFNTYKSTQYNADGSRISYVEKHPDGTADAIYYDADGEGGILCVKLDKNKEVIEKKYEK